MRTTKLLSCCPFDPGIQATLAAPVRAPGGVALEAVTPDGTAGGDRVVHHEGLVVAEVAVRQPEHQPVGQRIESPRGPGLGNAGARRAAGRRVRRDGQRGRSSERGIRRGCPVHVELPVGQGGRRGAERHQQCR